LKLLQHLNVEFRGTDNNIKTECLWCGSDSLSMDSEAPHQFSCFKCKEKGNAFSYLRKWYESLPQLKKSEAANLCDLKKGIKPLTLRECGVRFYADLYWLPIYNQKNHLISLHKYVPNTNIVYGSPKPTALTVVGMQNLGKSDTIWVAEGWWDYFTIYPQMKDTGIDLLATCGSYFNSAHLSVLKDKHIVLLYDNDTAGKDGIDYVARNVKSNTIPHLSLSYLDWGKITLPSGQLESGFDVRDLHLAFSER